MEGAVYTPGRKPAGENQLKSGGSKMRFIDFRSKTANSLRANFKIRVIVIIRPKRVTFAYIFSRIILFKQGIARSAFFSVRNLLS